MNLNNRIAHAVLWAAAIIASAVTGAPAVLSVILLPALAAISLLVVAPARCSAAAAQK
jgi:hypothetical protein